MFAPDDFVFTEGRRFRWWWQLISRPAAVASFVVAGVAAVGTVAVQTGPIRIGRTQLEPLQMGESKLEAPVTRLPVAAHRIASPPPEAKVIPSETKVAPPRVESKTRSARVESKTRSALVSEEKPLPAAPRKPAPPPAAQPARSVAQDPSLPPAVKTLVAPVTITSSTMKNDGATEPMPPPAATRNAETARTAATPPTAAPGWLVVSSRPWGSLYVDGRAYGTTPQTNLWLPPGAHRVEIRRPGFQPFVASVTIDSNREHRLTRVTLTPVSQ